MKKVVLIVNPSSGGEKAKEYKHLVIEKLEPIFDEVEVKYTEKSQDATNFAKKACEEKVHSVFGMGGDGTVNEIINGLAQQDYIPKFGFFPLGTVNDLARALNIPLDAQESIEKINLNKTTKIDIGKINDKYFMNVVAVGSIPNALNDVESKDKTRYGKFAYISAGLKEIANMDFYGFSLVIDGVKREIKTSLLIIGLTNSIGGNESILPNAEVDDNTLHIVYIKDSNLFETIKAIPDFLMGIDESSNNVEYITCKEIDINLCNTSDNLSVNVDGDEGVELPISIKVLPSHLELYVC